MLTWRHIDKDLNRAGAEKDLGKNQVETEDLEVEGKLPIPFLILYDIETRRNKFINFGYNFDNLNGEIDDRHIMLDKEFNHKLLLLNFGDDENYSPKDEDLYASN